MAKLSFDAPQDSPAHVALHQWVVQQGLDELAFHRLLWLINAHPRLVAYVQVFRNIAALQYSKNREYDNR
jgi:hypothetical protein